MNFIDSIKTHVTGLVDGTCFNKLKQMDNEAAKNTAIKVFACAIIAAIITAIFLPILAPVIGFVVGAGIFAYDTIGYKPPGPIERLKEDLREHLKLDDI